MKFPEHWVFLTLRTSRGPMSSIAQHSHGGTRCELSSSQQVAEEFIFVVRPQLLSQSARGAYFTVLIERLWPKRRILEIYLNIAEFGPGTYGAEAAAQRFFHKPAARLTRTDAAVLAAVLPNPQRYSATSPSRYIQQRRDWILNQMQALGGPEMLNEIDAYPDRRRGAARPGGQNADHTHAL